MKTRMYELTPEFDSRKSFYGKAHVVQKEDGSEQLYSYNTLVAEVNKTTQSAKVFGTYSQTTLRHIKELLLQSGVKAESKKQIEKDYM